MSDIITMDPQINYGSVTINYTYDNQTFKDTGSFTINDPNDPYNFIAVINDTNFPSNCLTPGIFIEVILDKNSNISSVSLNFNNRYLYQTIPSSVPISNVTIDGNVIPNNNPIYFKYNNIIFQTIVQAYILYSFTPETLSVSVPVSEPVSVPVSDCFSPAALNQVATTRDQASALLTTLDPGNVFLSRDKKTQIASEAGLIGGHIGSIGECVQKINDTLTKK